MTPHADKPTAFQEGHRGFWQADAVRGDNPYPLHSCQRDEWLAGWAVAHTEWLTSKPNPYNPCVTTC